MEMVCKCGGREFFTEEHGNQTGLYCSACGKWQKWLKKDEIRLFNHGVKVEERFSAGTSQGSYCRERNQGIYCQSSAHLHESCRHEGA